MSGLTAGYGSDSLVLSAIAAVCCWSSPERSENLVRRLAGRFDKQAVLAEGQAEKYRYILWCDIVKQQLTIENGFSLPILLTQKRVRASLELEYHIIDCSRGRSVAADRIVVHGNGPATLQCHRLYRCRPESVVVVLGQEGPV